MQFVRNALLPTFVSLQGTERSGLGIEAERAAIARFAESEKLNIIAESVQAETGMDADAPIVGR
jgi:hypothetical protein